MSKEEIIQKMRSEIEHYRSKLGEILAHALENKEAHPIVDDFGSKAEEGLNPMKEVVADHNQPEEGSGDE